MATCWAVLVDSYMSSYDNVLEIDAQVCWRPISDTPLFGENVSEAIKRTFVSINRCVAVIVYNSAWLAYCSSGEYLTMLHILAFIYDKFRTQR